MIELYINNTNKFLYTFIILLVLSIALFIVNSLLYSFLKTKSINSTRSTRRGLETYEFRVNSISSVTSLSSYQFVILAILFLIFDLKLTLLIPFVISFNFSLSISNFCVLIYIFLIIYSIIAKMYNNIIVWYKNRSIKYL